MFSGIIILYQTVIRCELDYLPTDYLEEQRKTKNSVGSVSSVRGKKV